MNKWEEMEEVEERDLPLRDVKVGQLREELLAAGWRGKVVSLLLDKPPLPKEPIRVGMKRLRLVA